MLDVYNIPVEFWTSLEFLCFVFGIFPMLLCYAAGLLLTIVETVTESEWYKNRNIQNVEVQTDPDRDLMHYYYYSTPHQSINERSDDLHDSPTSSFRPITPGSSSVKSTPDLTSSSSSTRSSSISRESTSSQATSELYRFGSLISEHSASYSTLAADQQGDDESHIKTDFLLFQNRESSPIVTSDFQDEKSDGNIPAVKTNNEENLSSEISSFQRNTLRKTLGSCSESGFYQGIELRNRDPICNTPNSGNGDSCASETYLGDV
ncbi:hypothetical protein SK128_011532 [Halocaridina rubra]|uniref:Uncharacterized protein n=1 Tax=Halocaridina rubra TaxID=373956 RepID=A0AAN8XTP2_HALRR